MKDMRKWGNLLYLIIPLLLIFSIAAFSNGRAEKKATYSEIMNLFQNHEITEYTVNFSSGALLYKVKGDNTEKKYALPSVDLFIMDIHEDVVQYNAEHPDAQIEYDYKAGTNNSFWFCTSDETYLVLDCANDLGPSYYCDVNSSDYAFCVEKCSEEYANKFIQYGACDEDNTMELFRCELGQSGLYGSFGGRWGQSICAGSTKALSCEGVSSGSFPNTLSCTTCTSGNENGIITATCQ